MEIKNIMTLISFDLYRRINQSITFCLIFMTSLLATAHEDDYRMVEISLTLPAISNPLVTDQGEVIHLAHAYLSSFSLELIACPELLSPQSGNNHSVNQLLSWLIPSAQANHGVRFTKPTQVPIQKLHNLLEGTQLALGTFQIPVGHYCEINYTFGHTSKKMHGNPIKDLNRYSLYIAGDYTNKTATKKTIMVSSDYAFGQNIKRDIEIAAQTKNTEALELKIKLNTEAAFKTLSFTQPAHKIARKLFLELPKYLTVEVSLNE